MNKLSNIILIVNKNKDSKLDLTKKIIAHLRNKSVNVFVEDNIELCEDIKIINRDILNQIDLAVILGGDGTILDFAHRYLLYDIPICGINLGRVGCLTSCNVEDSINKMDLLINKEYNLDNRITINCYYDCNKIIVFNEVVIYRGNYLKTILINININGKKQYSFYGDGCIISTPSGSTAYNLSCGGPILMSNLDNIVITPISPQLSSASPIVISGEDDVEIYLSDFEFINDSDNPIICIDGLLKYNLKPNEKIEIRKSNKKFKIIKYN